MSDQASVLIFGAIGDGRHDNTAAIQTAVTSALRAGGSAALYFPHAKCYTITRPINFTAPGAISIKGDGGMASPICLHADSGITAFNFQQQQPQSSAIVIDGMYFQAPTGTDATGPGNVAINLHNNNGVVIRNTTIIGYRVAMQFSASFAPIIDSNTVTGSLETALLFTDSSGNSASILHNSLRDNGMPLSGAAIALGNNSFGPFISGNKIEGNYRGILFRGASSVVLLGNYIEGSAADNIYFSSGINRGYDIRANWFGSARHTCLRHIAGASFEKNTLYDWSVSFDATAENVSIGDNQLLGTAELNPPGSLASGIGCGR